MDEKPASSAAPTPLDSGSGDPSDPRGDQPAVVVVAGPTASGKSALALDLARDLDATIINADSMQIYRELRVLTARPDVADLARAPHRLYGVLPGTERCSAGRWRDLALAEIDAAVVAGRQPLLVGGTGLYLRALEEGLAPIPDVPSEVRVAAVAEHQALGGAAFHEALARRDPIAAARLNANDSQRLIRAWEVVEATGRSLSDWLSMPQRGVPYRFVKLALVPPRDALYAACDQRFRQMLDAGALAEVEALLKLGLDPGLPVMKALGVRELASYLAGELDLAAATAAAQTWTRRYAKRQLTWIRNQIVGKDRDTIAVDTQYSECFYAKIFANIRQKLLTL